MSNCSSKHNSKSKIEFTTEYFKSKMAVVDQLLCGEAHDVSSSPYDAEQEAILVLVACNVPFDLVWARFNCVARRGHYFEISAQSPELAERWLVQAYRAAHKQLGHQATNLAERATVWALTRPWPGARGNYDLAVYLAHTSLAATARKVYYPAKTRELAVRAGVSTTAVDNANRRLIQQGLIVRVAKRGCNFIAGINNTNSYRLVDREDKQRESPESVDLMVEKSRKNLGHAAFRWNALGKTCFRIFLLLQTGPRTALELSRDTGQDLTSVRRCLQRMASLQDSFSGQMYPMVKEVANGKWHLLTVDLDKVAEILRKPIGRGPDQLKQELEELREYLKKLELEDARVVVDSDEMQELL